MLRNSKYLCRSELKYKYKKVQSLEMQKSMLFEKNFRMENKNFWAMSRVGKWSRISCKTRLKIGHAISRDLKCKTCKTQNLANIMHFGSFSEGNITFSVISAKESC